MLVLASITCFSETITAQINRKAKVAVYVSGNLSKINKQIVTSEVNEWITRSNNYAAFERAAEYLEELTKEEDYQTSGEVSNDQIVSISNRWGADLVAVFRILLTEDNTHYVTGRLINLETGEILKSVSQTRKIVSTEELIAFSNRIAYLLLVQ